MILFIHSFQVLNTLSCMVLTAVNADVGGHFNLVIGLLVFRRRRSYSHPLPNIPGLPRINPVRSDMHTLFVYVIHCSSLIPDI